MNMLILLVLGLMFNTLFWFWWNTPAPTMSESIGKVLRDS